jgi:hypothetical protein
MLAPSLVLGDLLVSSPHSDENKYKVKQHGSGEMLHSYQIRTCHVCICIHTQFSDTMYLVFECLESLDYIYKILCAI